jgi:hypothetical protein
MIKNGRIRKRGKVTSHTCSARRKLHDLGLCRYNDNRSSRLYLYYYIRHHRKFLLVNSILPFLDPHDRAGGTTYQPAKPLRPYRRLPCNPKCLRMVSLHVFSQSVSSHSRSLRQPEHPLELGVSRHSPFDLRYRLSSPLAAVLTASAISSQLDNENAIDIDTSTYFDLDPCRHHHTPPLVRE